MPVPGRAVAAALSGLLAALVAAPAGALPAPGATRPLLDRPQPAADALARPGLDVAALARLNGTTGPALRRTAAADRSLWMDRGGRLFYVDPARRTTQQAEPVVQEAPFPYTETFALHSRPGAQRTIYLDFTGHLVTGTAWNGGSRPASYQVEPYDTDGAPASFSTAEQDVVQATWQRVAEDYAPFDVDVTTQEPPQEAITRSGQGDDVYGTRVLISPTSFYFSSCRCGGVAYIGVFDLATDHDYYQPAFVFTQGVGTGAKSIAEAASHEAGHNLGLNHDGTSSQGYYAGHGAWAPIMGVGYYEPVTQWSKGEYAGANNGEDDFAVIQANGGPLRADDHGDTAATATALATGSTTTAARISTRADRDVFAVDAAAGTLSAAVASAAVGANLDAKVEVLDAAGTVVASNDPAVAQVDASSANGLGASLSVSVAAGRYYVRVDGVGYGDPASSGYSDYASVGAYTLTVTAAAGEPPPPPATTAIHVGGLTGRTVLLANRRIAAEVTVTVTDATGAPQPGVTVTGTWSGTVSASATGTTEADGTLLLTSPGTKSRKATFTFTVGSLAKTGTTYDASADTASSITIR